MSENSANEALNAPWEVYFDILEMRDSPDSSGHELKVLKKGDTVEGSEITIHPETDEEWLQASCSGLKGFVSLTGLIRIHPENRQEGNLTIGKEVVDRWWGVPISYEPDDLQDIPKKYCIDDGKEYKLRKEALSELVKMLDAAMTEQIELKVISSYRSGPYQENLYKNSIRKSGAGQRYGARPGHSEHQLGTTVDLTDPDQEYNFAHEFQETKWVKWLEKNAARFGFRRSYTDDNITETGYISEPWHWRYMGH